MVDGGTYNGYTITGIGLTRAARIQYRALTTYLTSSSGFLDNFDALIQACNDLVGTTGITSSDCGQVQNAMLAVEMNAQWGCAPAGPLRTPSLCPAGGTPSHLLQEGFETGAAGWTTPSTSATVWDAQTYFVADGNMSAVGPDPDGTSDHSLQSPGPGLLLPAGARLMFDHAYSFDAGFDGGVVEYSTNNGASWLDAGALMDAGLVYDNAIIDGVRQPAGESSGVYPVRIVRLPEDATGSGRPRRPDRALPVPSGDGFHHRWERLVRGQRAPLHLHRGAGSAGHHGIAGASDRDRRRDGDVHRDRGGQSHVALSMAEERRADCRRHDQQCSR